ncbi:MAG: DUF922 domain-containing protein [Chitinophagaceae bacterium]|nr:DUF922 domain-containing protein [Chitinophagaceae bacterium]MBK7680786.1 DUF922 domain-containing protein [Chitinophagaceae bacterium]MBK9465197.1 DUF922 domain-containing protein [Chitinophagaceae bacterium]MBK9660344.1 DUF922 domain-containing protein [Chitinophagaceae bacterium]MBK9938324.1 DUF922 domain-containing protein [Chitinophagaceae bacterium]
MKYLLKYFLILLLFPSVLFSQSSNEEVLEWDPSRKLSWADYKARPNPDSDAAASTTTYLGINYNITSRSFSYKIYSRFSKTRSWGLHKTAYILSHEQGHFDIAEIFARKLHKKMSEYEFNKKTYNKDLEKIYRDVTKEKEDTQNQYDKETNHSINKTEQLLWLKKIAAMLEEYADWADY